MLNLTATSLFDGTLATFLVVFTLLLILITKKIRKILVIMTLFVIILEMIS